MAFTSINGEKPFFNFKNQKTLIGRYEGTEKYVGTDGITKDVYLFREDETKILYRVNKYKQLIDIVDEPSELQKDTNTKVLDFCLGMYPETLVRFDFIGTKTTKAGRPFLHLSIQIDTDTVILGEKAKEVGKAKAVEKAKSVEK